MAEIPGPLGSIINVGGHVGDRGVTQRGSITYVGNEPISSRGDYIGNTPIRQTPGGLVYVGNEPVRNWGGSSYVGPDKVTRR